MDLSQQELPLTAYFHKGTKNARPPDASSKKGKPSEASTTGGLSSKRKKSAEGSARNSKPSIVQLPTPASSARKRVSLRGVSEIALKSHSVSPSVTLSEENAVLRDEIDSERLEIEPSPSKSTSTLRHRTNDRLVQLADPHSTTPGVGQRKRQRTDARGSESLSHCRSSLKIADIPLATPLTASRRRSELVHDVEEQSPTESSSYHSPPPRPDFETTRLPGPAILHNVPPPLKFSAQSVNTLLHSRVGSTSSDPFQTRDVSAVSSSPRLGARSSKVPDIPMVPVPSSQSQYLLRIDATPKRKRVARQIELVSSSQPQEERELTLSIPPETFDLDTSSVGGSPKRHQPLVIDAHTSRSHARSPRPGRRERKSQHGYMLGSTPIVSPVTSPAGPSRSFFATKKVMNVLPLLNTPRALRHQTKTPQKPPRNEPITDIPDDDSLTEPESELDIPMQGVAPSLGATNQVPAAKSRSQRSRKSTQRKNFPSVGEDSATEAESDTEILHCFAEISRNQGRERRSRAPSNDTPSRPVISPLVSPARSRIAASIGGSTQFFMQEGAGLSIPLDISPSRPSATSKLTTHAESVPSAVQNFIDMFEGDESYPADFPQSLRF